MKVLFYDVCNYHLVGRKETDYHLDWEMFNRMTTYVHF